MARDEAPAGRAWCCSAVRTYTVSRRRWETHPSSLYGPATRRRTASRGSAAQGCPGCGEDVLPGIGATVADPDAACRDTCLRGDFQQPQPDRFALCFRPLPARQRRARFCKKCSPVPVFTSGQPVLFASLTMLHQGKQRDGCARPVRGLRADRPKDVCHAAVGGHLVAASGRRSGAAPTRRNA